MKGNIFSYVCGMSWQERARILSSLLICVAAELWLQYHVHSRSFDNMQLVFFPVFFPRAILQIIPQLAEPATNELYCVLAQIASSTQQLAKS